MNREYKKKNNMLKINTRSITSANIRNFSCRDNYRKMVRIK